MWERERERESRVGSAKHGAHVCAFTVSRPCRFGVFQVEHGFVFSYTCYLLSFYLDLESSEMLQGQSNARKRHSTVLLRIKEISRFLTLIWRLDWIFSSWWNTVFIGCILELAVSNNGSRRGGSLSFWVLLVGSPVPTPDLLDHAFERTCGDPLRRL